MAPPPSSTPPTARAVPSTSSAKIGPIESWLRNSAGHPIGCFHLEPENAWSMRSWDRFQIPKPFTRIAVSWGRWINVPEDADATAQESLRLQLDASLESARARAFTHLGKSTA